MERMQSLFGKFLVGFLFGLALVLLLGSCSTLDGIARNLTAPASAPTPENPNPRPAIVETLHNATQGTPVQAAAETVGLLLTALGTAYNTVRGEQAHKKIAANAKKNGNGNGAG